MAVGVPKRNLAQARDLRASEELEAEMIERHVVIGERVVEIGGKIDVTFVYIFGIGFVKDGCFKLY